MNLPWSKTLVTGSVFSFLGLPQCKNLSPQAWNPYLLQTAVLNSAQIKQSKKTSKKTSSGPFKTSLRIQYTDPVVQGGQIKTGLDTRVCSSHCSPTASGQASTRREEPRQYEMERKVWAEKRMKEKMGEGSRQGHRCDITLTKGAAGVKVCRHPILAKAVGQLFDSPVY